LVTQVSAAAKDKSRKGLGWSVSLHREILALQGGEDVKRLVSEMTPRDPAAMSLPGCGRSFFRAAVAV